MDPSVPINHLALRTVISLCCDCADVPIKGSDWGWKAVTMGDTTLGVSITGQHVSDEVMTAARIMAGLLAGNTSQTRNRTKRARTICGRKFVVT